MPSPLAESFLAALPPGLRVQAKGLGRLGPRLAAMAHQASGRWPQLGVSDVAFVAYVAERLEGAGQLGDQLGQIHADDLFLACGCASGSSEAISAFEQLFFPEVRSALSRKGGLELADELTGILRETLFVARAGARPKIADYTGRGSLEAWFKVAVARHAVNVMSRNRAPKGTASDADFSARGVPLEDPELGQLKRLYRKDFSTAFAQALERLPPADRALLRYRFIEGLTVNEIAHLERVHPATVARWLARLRQTVLENISGLLSERLGVEGDELVSMMRMLRSQVDVTIEKLLRG